MKEIFSTSFQAMDFSVRDAQPIILDRREIRTPKVVDLFESQTKLLRCKFPGREDAIFSDRQESLCS